MKKAHLLALVYLPFLLGVAARAGTPPPASTPRPASTAKPAPTVTLQDFKLVGDLGGEGASFILTANAKVEGDNASIQVLSGPVALTSIGSHEKWQIRADQGRYLLAFEKEGKYPIQLKFDAVVQKGETWKRVDFRVTPGVLQPIVLHGLGPDTQFEFPGAARPERKDNDFVSLLPSDGQISLSWKEAKPEGEGKLFFAGEMLSQVSVSPGQMRQTSLLNFKVMQGELSQVTLLLHGAGQVIKVETVGNDNLHDNLLGWDETNAPGADTRLLVVRFNQPQKDQFAVLVQVQTALGAFPQTTNVTQLQPEGATRFAGYVRIVNDGAVRLSVPQASGLSQIAPEQFPESNLTRALLRPTGNQQFVYRFSGADYKLQIQADQILPEVSVSDLLLYTLAEHELTISAEFELDIREAPLRELLIRVPSGYTIAQPQAAGLTDWFPPSSTNQAEATIRLVYGQPISGRQLVRLQLARNEPLGSDSWDLPRIEVLKAKSVRGDIGVAAAAGFRLTPKQTKGLREVDTAFFPKRIAGLQTAFKLNDPAWQAALGVERLPQTVQADVLHIFSIGQGFAYGSSIINYVVSGAPVGTFTVAVPDEMVDVRFAGKDLQPAWKKTARGYEVTLNTPVSGAYTLLATYARPFKARGDELAFTGVRALDAPPDREHGYTLIVSAYQFLVQPTDVSPRLESIEPGEVPSEYRLFFDAPILAAYRYSSSVQPFNLKLKLTPLAQGGSLNQVVDRASMTTHITKEGQAVTDVHYFVKNRGNPNFRLTLATNVMLWSATVDGEPVVPVKDQQWDVIRLPRSLDPDRAFNVYLNLASISKDPQHIRLAAPVLGAPVMLAEWELTPDEHQRLVYIAHPGSLTPEGGVVDVSGFAQLGRVFAQPSVERPALLLGLLLLGMGVAAALWRWGAGVGVYRASPRHLLGTVLGLAALAVAAYALISLVVVVGQERVDKPISLSFLAPVQQPNGAMTVEVANVENKAVVTDVLAGAWPLLLALVVWLYGLVAGSPATRMAAKLVGWTLAGWAALRCANGAEVFLLVVGAFLLLHVVIPALRALWQAPAPPAEPIQPEAPPGGAASATVALLLGGLLAAGLGGSGCETLPTQSVQGTQISSAETLTQDIRIEDKFAIATAKLHWQAKKGELLPLLYEPAVLTRLSYPTNSLRLVAGTSGPKQTQQLVAEKDGSFDVELGYDLRITRRDPESGIVLPMAAGLINRVNLTVQGLDVDVASPQAIFVQRNSAGSNTVAALTLAPVNEVWVGWKPRSRDVRHEKPVFHAELTQLYVPEAGVIEGAHYVTLRPAQGELSELVFDVPAKAGITDVIDPSRPPGTPGSMVSLWRFDPDTHKLRVTLTPAQSHAFTVLVRSQVATGTLPFTQSLGLLSIEGAAGQDGRVGIATGNDVHLESPPDTQLPPEMRGFSPVNLEDFPAGATAPFQGQIAGLMLHRAYHYSEPSAVIPLQASAVQPEVWVETQNRLSLGEDRALLAVQAGVDIKRAGIFELNFTMPEGFDVESITGQALSQWSESKSDAGRVINIHLVGKIMGQQRFDIVLSGPGVKATNAWVAPKVVFHNAARQVGTLLVVPEKGLRVQQTELSGAMSVDPASVGIRQPGVLAFTIEQTPWSLVLSVERVAAWATVTSLEHVTVNEAQLKYVANLQYVIENAGVRALHVLLPTNADNVKFQGNLVKTPQKTGTPANGLQEWEVPLERRLMDKYLLQVTYQTVLTEQAETAVLRGVVATEVSRQDGWLTVQSAGRLQVSPDAQPESLQPAEWQAIPSGLKMDLPTTAASFTYRLIDADFALPLRIIRHKAAELLAGRINKADFHSVISDAGQMLTHVTLQLVPGDMRLLGVTFPTNATFWFAFANQNGVWPWLSSNKYLIPLDQQAHRRSAIPVEVYYSCKVKPARDGSLDLDLVAPRFELPLQDINWRVSLGEQWKVTKWTGKLQLEGQQEVPHYAATDIKAYLTNEKERADQRTLEAQQLYAAANKALNDGDPQQARRSFQAAYEISGRDAPFNEDARVQLQKVKLQEAIIGLNVRQAAATGDTAALGNRFRDLRDRKEINYTQQDVSDLLSRFPEENASYVKVAAMLISQQDAAVSSATPIRASMPEQGRLLTFHRAVEVNPDAQLNVAFQATSTPIATPALRIGIIVLTLAFMAVFALAARRRTGAGTEGN